MMWYQTWSFGYSFAMEIFPKPDECITYVVYVYGSLPSASSPLFSFGKSSRIEKAKMADERARENWLSFSPPPPPPLPHPSHFCPRPSFRALSHSTLDDLPKEKRGLLAV